MAAPFAVPHSLVSKISEMFHQDDSMVSRGVLVIESRFKFVQLKGQSLFQGETITNSKNTLMKFKNPLLKNHWANFNKTWHKASLGDEDSSLFK